MLYWHQAAGLYAAGFAFEFVSGLGFGAGHLMLALLGRNPAAVTDFYFQTGRKGGARALEYWGYLEMLLGITGQGGGWLATATGAGAAVGLPATALSMGLVAAGAGHVARGRSAYLEADEAARRTGGRSVARPPFKLLSEEEVRRLLGSQATPEAVARFLEFQAHVAQKAGKHWRHTRVGSLLERHPGLGPVLVEWLQEIGPEGTLAVLERYADYRHILGAITEHRLAQRLVRDKDVVWLQVVPHSSHHGADVYFVERVIQDGRAVLRPAIADAKGSLSGMNVRRPSAFIEGRAKGTIQKLKEALRKAWENGELETSLYNQVLASAGNPDIYIGTGGTAAMSQEARQALARELQQQGIHSTVSVIPLD
jgi:hypothetical protein